MRPTPLLITMLAAGGLLGSPVAIMAQDSGLGEVQVAPGARPVRCGS